MDTDLAMKYVEEVLHHRHEADAVEIRPYQGSRPMTPARTLHVLVEGEDNEFFEVELLVLRATKL